MCIVEETKWCVICLCIIYYGVIMNLILIVYTHTWMNWCNSFPHFVRVCVYYTLRFIIMPLYKIYEQLTHPFEEMWRDYNYDTVPWILSHKNIAPTNSVLFIYWKLAKSMEVYFTNAIPTFSLIIIYAFSSENCYQLSKFQDFRPAPRPRGADLGSCTGNCPSAWPPRFLPVLLLASMWLHIGHLLPLF